MAGLILFGAGVSAFSPGIAPGNPPLGAKLFDSLQEKDAFFKQIDESLGEQFRKNFEDGMDIFNQTRNVDIGTFLRKMSWFFLQFSPIKQQSSYFYTLNLIKSNKIKSKLATLNYDLLLDSDLDAVGGIRGCISPEYITKIHGAPNVWPDIIGQMRGCTFSGCGTNIEAPVKLFSKEAAISLCETEDSTAPAMSLYAVGKKVYYCSNYIKSQIQRFEYDLMNAKWILIAGVHLNLEDSHIWGPLSKSGTRIGIINPAFESYQSWGAEHAGLNIHHISNRIEDIRSDKELEKKLLRFMTD
jgi:hypothetical protein